MNQLVQKTLKLLYTVFAAVIGSTVLFSAQAIADVETMILDGLGNQKVLAVDINNNTVKTIL